MVPIQKNDTAAVFGGNYGEFASRLTNLVKFVYVLEQDLDKASIARRRLRARNNCKIFSSDIVSFIEELPVDCNLIIIQDMQVFQNAFLFRKTLAEISKRFVDSAVIILCNNSDGIRYDASRIKKNKKFLQNHFEIKKDELLEVLIGSGYLNYQFYYPYPESTYALSIFSDRYLPTAEGQIKEYSMKNLQTDYFRDGRREYQLIQKAIREGKFSEKNNSFLVLTGKIDGLQCPVYIKHSNQRSDLHKICTEIYSDGTVVKRPLCKAGRRHLYNMKVCTDRCILQYKDTPFKTIEASFQDYRYSYHYIEGNSFLQVLDSALETDEETFLDLFCQWRDAVLKAHDNSFFSKSKEFITVFGNPDLSAQSRSGTVNNVDLVFDNIIIDGDSWYILDNEWSFQFPVPVKYILFRGLFDYQHRCLKMSKNLAEKCWKLLDIDRTQYDVFHKMEKNFQRYLKADVKKIL